jgi:hypothetical protein
MVLSSLTILTGSSDYHFNTFQLTLWHWAAIIAGTWSGDANLYRCKSLKFFVLAACRTWTYHYQVLWRFSVLYATITTDKNKLIIRRLTAKNILCIFMTRKDKLVSNQIDFIWRTTFRDRFLWDSLLQVGIQVWSKACCIYLYFFLQCDMMTHQLDSAKLNS